MTFPVFASGDVLNASDMNAVGLWLVKTQTIGSAVSSVTVTGAFSSNYENYKIIINGGVASATDADLRLSLGSTSTGYYAAGFYTGGSWGAVVTAQRQTNAAYWAAIAGSTSTLSADIELRNPNLAKVTEIFSRTNSASTSGYTNYWAGYLNDSTQYTAFTVTVGTGTITGGTIRVYGYRN